MKTTLRQRWLSLLLCAVLLAAAALGTTGCGGRPADPAPPAAEQIAEDGAVLGEGETEFPLTITDGAGAETHVTVQTDQTTVGEALQEAGLIQGEEGPYGLYIKTVNGITADYDADQTYWAFYINGAYAASGVDTTEIVQGDEYALVVERG